MDFAEVVGDNEQSNAVTVICKLAGESKAKARKASVERPDAKVEPFNMACANLVHVRLASNGFKFDAGALRRAVTPNRVESVPICQRVKIVFAV